MSAKELKQLFLIIVVFIAACVETDIYLPAFPDMMVFFKVSESQIQQLLTWNFIGLCISGPFYGPLSDSLGRQKPLLVALVIFWVGSLMTVFSQSFEVMLVGRLLQGLGSGGCFTLGTAIIFDVFEEKKALNALNHLNVAIPMIMAGAPLLGGYLNYMYGFRSNFWAITLLVFLSLVVCLVFFKETLPHKQRVPFQFQQTFQDFYRVCKNVAFWQLTSVISLLWAGYLTFLSFTAVLFMVEFEVAKKAFPFFQAALLIAYVLASLTCNRSIQTWGLPFVKKAGVTCILLGGTALGIVTLVFPKNPYLLTLAMLPYAFGASWTQTPYFGEVMAIFPSMKGVVASLLTSLRLLITVGFLGGISQIYNGTIVPLTVGIVGICGFLIPTLLLYEKKCRFKAGALASVEGHNAAGS